MCRRWQDKSDFMESSRWEQESSMNEQLKMKALWAHVYVRRTCACYYQIGFGLDHFYSYWTFQTKKKSFPFRFIFLQFYFIFFRQCRTMPEMVFFSHLIAKGPNDEQTMFKSVNKIGKYSQCCRIQFQSVGNSRVKLNGNF